MIIQEYRGSSTPEHIGAYYGIECELELAGGLSRGLRDIARIAGSYNVISDGSLRNAGREVVSTPMRVDAGRTWLADVLNGAQAAGCEATARCGMHVHRNVQDVEQESLVNLVVAYIAAEPLLFRMCGHSRRDNIYCVPINWLPQQRQQVALMAENPILTLEVIRNWEKYSAINLATIYPIGTVEFRMAPQWMHSRDAVAFLDAVHHLCEYGLSVDRDRLRADILSGEVMRQCSPEWISMDMVDEIAEEWDCLENALDVLPNPEAVRSWDEVVAAVAAA